MFLALSGPVIFDLLINTVFGLVGMVQWEFLKSQKYLTTCLLPVPQITDGLNLPVVEYAEARESLRATVSMPAE